MHVQGTVDSGANDFRERARARALRRASAAAPRALRSGAFIIAILLHLLGAVWLYFLMKPKPSVDRDRIEVRLLDAGPSVPPLPEPPPKAQSTSTPAQVAAKFAPTPAAASARAAASVPTAQTEPSQALVSSARLFNPDGSIRLPAQGKASVHEQGMQRARELMSRGHNILHCAHTAFDPRETAEEAGNTMRGRAKLAAFAYQRPWEIQAQHDSMTQAGIDAATDRAIARRKIEDKACDDLLYHRPYPQAPSAKKESAP